MEAVGEERGLEELRQRVKTNWAMLMADEELRERYGFLLSAVHFEGEFINYTLDFSSHYLIGDADEKTALANYSEDLKSAFRGEQLQHYSRQRVLFEH